MNVVLRSDLYAAPGEGAGRESTSGLAAVQMDGSGGPSAAHVHELAGQGLAGPAAELPFLDRIQSSFGDHDVSGIQAHIGGPAAQASEAMGAMAYATGNHVAFREAPDLHTAAHEAAHIVQQRGGVQLAGGVGQAGDHYERHADAVADRVVAGQSAAELLDTYASEPAPLAEQGTQMQTVQLKGEPTVRRGSKGSTVKKLQQRLNAKEVVEPPLKIDGDFGELTEAAVIAFQNTHQDSTGTPLEPDGIAGPLTWGAINDERKTPEIANTEEELGEHIAVEMNKNNEDPHEEDRGVHYDFNYKASFPHKWKDDYSNGYADPQYFERIGWMDWRLKPKMSASAGIQAWLRGLTIAECNSAIVAIQTDAVRAAIGDAKFDEHFGSTDKLVPMDRRMRIKTGTTGTVVEGMNKLTEGAKAKDAGTFGNRPVKQGDWCYFYNHPQYLLKHPGGAFQGENAIFMGLDAAGEQIWSGMGVSNATEKEMLEAMMSAYNAPRDEWDDAEIERIKARNGGSLPPEYDLKSGIFPVALSDISEILTAPEYEIKGVKRKGGFIAHGAYRLDTTKIDALTK